MNHLENFIRMMNGEPYERVPFDLPMTPPILDELEKRCGTRDPVQTFDLPFQGVWAITPDDSAKWKAAYQVRGITVPRGANVYPGGCVERPAPPESVGSAYHLTEMFHPLGGIKSVEEMASLPWYDLDDPIPYASLARQVEDAHAEGRVAVCWLECTVFESAWYLRGMDNLFMDLVEENGISDWLLDRFRDRSARVAEAASRAGVDLIRLGDDVGTQRGMMLSVPFWREHLKWRLADVIDASRVGGRKPFVQYHSDGDVREIFEDLISLGVDILNPIQPECMPVDEVVPQWKDKVAFSGMIGTQTTMPFGSTQDVRNAVAKCQHWIERGARMFISPTHVLEPDVPWENIEAFVESVRLPALSA